MWYNVNDAVHVEQICLHAINGAFYSQSNSIMLAAEPQNYPERKVGSSKSFIPKCASPSPTPR
jgi:hypothetical protein